MHVVLKANNICACFVSESPNFFPTCDLAWGQDVRYGLQKQFLVPLLEKKWSLNPVVSQNIVWLYILLIESMSPKRFDHTLLFNPLDTRFHHVHCTLLLNPVISQETFESTHLFNLVVFQDTGFTVFSIGGLPREAWLYTSIKSSGLPRLPSLCMICLQLFITS